MNFYAWIYLCIVYGILWKRWKPWWCPSHFVWEINHPEHHRGVDICCMWFSMKFATPKPDLLQGEICKNILWLERTPYSYDWKPPTWLQDQIYRRKSKTMVDQIKTIQEPTNQQKSQIPHHLIFSPKLQRKLPHLKHRASPGARSRSSNQPFQAFL